MDHARTFDADATPGLMRRQSKMGGVTTLAIPSIDRKGRVANMAESAAQISAQFNLPPGVLQIGGDSKLPELPPPPKLAAVQIVQPPGMPAAAPPPPLLMPPPPAPDAVVEVKHPVAVNTVKGVLGRIYRAAMAKGANPAQDKTETFSLSDPELHPLVLETMVTGAEGTRWYAWEPETLKSMYADLEAMGTPLAQVNKDKLQAIAMLHVTNNPWRNAREFMHVAEALNGVSPDFITLKPIPSAFILAAARMMRAVQPRREFDSDDVVRYIATCCFADGVLFYPDPQMATKISPIIRGMAAKRMDPAEINGAEMAWNAFVERGGLDMPPQKINGLSEDHLIDRQIVNAYWMVSYAAEYEARMHRQLNALAAWALPGATE
jgi:hypothetical protein